MGKWTYIGLGAVLAVTLSLGGCAVLDAIFGVENPTAQPLDPAGFENNRQNVQDIAAAAGQLAEQIDPVVEEDSAAGKVVKTVETGAQVAGEVTRGLQGAVRPDGSVDGQQVTQAIAAGASVINPVAGTAILFGLPLLGSVYRMIRLAQFRREAEDEAEMQANAMRQTVIGVQRAKNATTTPGDREKINAALAAAQDDDTKAIVDDIKRGIAA